MTDDPGEAAPGSPSLPPRATARQRESLTAAHHIVVALLRGLRLHPIAQSARKDRGLAVGDARDAEGSQRPALLARMAELIGEIVAREGVFRVPKDAGSFLATVET